MQRSSQVTRDDITKVRDTCLCFAAQRAARQLARHFDNAFAPLALTNNQFSMLSAILGMEGPTLGQLAHFLGQDHATASAAVKKLVTRKLVTSKAHEEDGRSRHVTLTDNGLALLAQAMPIWEAEHKTVAEALGEQTTKRLRNDLVQLKFDF